MPGGDVGRDALRRGVAHTRGVTAPTQAAAAPPKASRRGRETALDMLRTLGVVFLLVIPLWFFGQASPGDGKRIRAIDPTEALRSFATDTGAPVASTPAGWIPNVATYSGGVLRVGFVDGNSYAEFTGGSGPMFLETYAGKGSVDGTVDVAGVSWQKYSSTDGHGSLVREVRGQTLLVGGIREDASDAQLAELAATVR